MVYPTPTFLSGLSRHFIASWNEYQDNLKLSNPRLLDILSSPEVNHEDLMAVISKNGIKSLYCL